MARFSCTGTIDVIRMTQFSCTGITDVYVRSEEHAKNGAVLIKKSEGTNPPYELNAWGQEIPASI
jgi:hypothetical protein